MMCFTNFHLYGTVLHFIIFYCMINQLIIYFLFIDPIPGGCNMEFSVEVAPYLEVSYTSALIKVKSQLASPPAPFSCTTGSMDYQVFHLYLEERDFESTSYFDGIRKMLTVNRIQQHGKKVSLSLSSSSSGIISQIVI